MSEEDRGLSGVGLEAPLLGTHTPAPHTPLWRHHPNSPSWEWDPLLPWEKAVHRQHSLGKPSSGACTPRGFMLWPH